MTRVELAEDRVRIGVGSGGRARREVYYDEIVRAELLSPGRRPELVLHRHDGGREVLGRLDAGEAARLQGELAAILGGGEDELSRTRGVGDVAERVARHAGRPGFMATGFVDWLLRAAARLGVSDVHLAPAGDGVRVRLRLDGTLHDVGQLPAARARRAIARLKVLAGLRAHRSDVPQEGRIALPGGPGEPEEFRLSCVPASGGERVAVRAYDRLKGRLAADELGLPAAALATLRRACALPQGVVVLSGPSASGKTTTAYALLREIRAGRGETTQLVTIEDPVEYRLDGVDQLEIAARQGNTAAQLLRSVLRQDVDVILLGEIRDPETAEVAFAAGTSGHLVVTTLHAGSAAEALVRLGELGVPPHVLATALVAVASQRLVRRTCTGCAGGGGTCATCGGSGYRGREAIAEVLRVDDAIRPALRERRAGGELEALARAGGMTTLREAADEKLRRATTTAAEIERVLG